MNGRTHDRKGELKNEKDSKDPRWPRNYQKALNPHKEKGRIPGAKKKPMLTFSFKCRCGYMCTSQRGLTTHQRSCAAKRAATESSKEKRATLPRSPILSFSPPASPTPSAELALILPSPPQPPVPSPLSQSTVLLAESVSQANLSLHQTDHLLHTLLHPSFSPSDLRTDGVVSARTLRTAVSLTREDEFRTVSLPHCIQEEAARLYKEQTGQTLEKELVIHMRSINHAVTSLLQESEVHSQLFRESSTAPTMNGGQRWITDFADADYCLDLLSRFRRINNESRDIDTDLFPVSGR